MHARGILDELRIATRWDRGAEQLNQTGGELARTVTELRSLTRALRGQEDLLAGLVGDASIVLDELGSRETALRTIVGSARVTLDALAANTASLSEGLEQGPPLLDEGRDVLVAVRPLLRDVRPLVGALERAAPHLSPILAEFPALTADTVEIVSELSGIPTLRKLLEVVELVGPSVPEIEAATLNLVSLLDYASAHRKGIAAFFANLADAGSHRDSTGGWVRVAAVFENGINIDERLPATCLPEDDVPVNTGLCSNAYPEPGDGLDNEPFEPGSYPQIEPYDP